MEQHILRRLYSTHCTLSQLEFLPQLFETQVHLIDFTAPLP